MRWVRNRPQRHENALASMAAVSVGAVVGVVVFYVARLFLARDPIDAADFEEGEGDGESEDDGRTGR